MVATVEVLTAGYTEGGVASTVVLVREDDAVIVVDPEWWRRATRSWRPWPRGGSAPRT